MKRIYLSLFVLSACAAPAPPEPPKAPLSDDCGASDYQSLVGQDATALEKVLILGQVRLIRPGTAVTLDFRADRINFYIDASNEILRIRCG